MRRNYILLHGAPNTSSSDLLCPAIFRLTLYHLWKCNSIFTLGRVVAAVLQLDLLRLNSAPLSLSAPLLPPVRGTRDAGRNLNGRSSLRSARPALVRPNMTIAPTSLTPRSVRQACRDGTWNYPSTAGICEGYVQANLVILPSKYADDFRNLCARNPVPCPLLGETKKGDPTIPSHLAADCDIRTDAPLYRVYKGGKLIEEKKDILAEWDDDDSVGFLIGCSFSFEAALINGGLTPRQIEIGRNVPMYRTKTPLAPAGREYFGFPLSLS